MGIGVQGGDPSRDRPTEAFGGVDASGAAGGGCLWIGAIVEAAPKLERQVDEGLRRGVVAGLAGPEFLSAAVIAVLFGRRQSGSRQAFDGGLRLQGQAFVIMVRLG